MSRLHAYLQLVRLPNVFTALADICAGYWLFSRKAEVTGTLGWLLVSSGALYSAGIVLNDLKDVDTDREERPGRPLPSGRVTTTAARNLAIFLSIAGLFSAAVAGRTMPLSLRHPAIVAVALLTIILAYDYLTKSSRFGPVTMGACRGLNLILGMSAGPAAMQGEANPFVVLPICALFLYVTAFTYFGREESGASKRRRLVAGLVGIALALLAVGLFAGLAMSNDMFTLILWLALCIHVIRIGLRAVRQPSPSAVQYAMKTFILAIIPFDAVIVSTAHGWIAALFVVALMVPAAFLGRFIYST